MRRSLVVGLVALSILVSTLGTANAESNGPAAFCRGVLAEQTSPVTGETFPAYMVPVRFTFGGETFTAPFAIDSFQACVSTVAGSMVDGAVPASEISTPAYLARCDYLEASGEISYPYTFYDLYPATKRADCVRILKGVHSGALPLPDFPVG